MQRVEKRRFTTLEKDNKSVLSPLKTDNGVTSPEQDGTPKKNYPYQSQLTETNSVKELR